MRSTVTNRRPTSEPAARRVQLDLEDLWHGPKSGHTRFAMSILWFVIGVVVCAALLYLAYRIEPHWVAKDGNRFLTTSETIDHEGKVVTRRREVRGTIMSDGLIMLGKRTMLKTRSSLWRIAGKSPEIKRGRLLYVLDTVPADPMGEKLILRIPTLEQAGPAVRRPAPAGWPRGQLTASRNSAIGSPTWSRLIRKASWPCGESISTYRLTRPSERSTSSIWRCW